MITAPTESMDIILRREPTMDTPELTADERHALDATTTQRQWDAATQVVLDARGGKFPPDWQLHMSTLGYAATQVGRPR